MKAKGMDKAIIAIENIAKLIPEIIHDIYEELNTSRNNILESMRGTPRQLKKIRVPGRKNVFHYPAQKGAPPAIMNGQLSGDLKVATEYNNLELGTTLKYGSRHEGTKNNPGHHPYMKPEFNKLLPRLPKSIMEVIKNANR